MDLEPLTVIAGPNGSGKSNLIDLVGLLSRLVSRDTALDAFNDHRGRPIEAFHSPAGFGPAAYEELLRREEIRFIAECDIELHPRIVDEVDSALAKREAVAGAQASYTRVTERLLRYCLEITLRPRSGEIFITDESLCALRRDLAPRAPSARPPFIERKRLGKEDRFIARVERQSHPRYFDTPRVRTLLSELSDPVCHPHVVAAAREIASWRAFCVEANRMRGEVGVQGADDPGRAGELLAPCYCFLQEKHPAALRSIEQNLRRFVPDIEGLRVDVRRGLLETVWVARGGAEFPARLLSEGTLRLLSILGIAVAPTPPTVVTYEEPENGVNPARLDVIADILRNAVELRHHGIQVIVTTHSALVCDLLHGHVLACTQSSTGGTRLLPMEFERDTLLFEGEVRRALNGAMKIAEGRDA